MPIVLIDANIEGHGAVIWGKMQAPEWQELTVALDVTLQTFADVGLDRAARDDVVWRFCQTHGYYLLTSNRNEESEDSLEATLKREGTATSLPVITLPLPDRVYHSPAFLERVACSMPRTSLAQGECMCRERNEGVGSRFQRVKDIVKR